LNDDKLTSNAHDEVAGQQPAAEKEEFEEKQRALEAVVTLVLQNLSSKFSGGADASAGQGGGGGTGVQAEADAIGEVA
jgi:hypothetical protein